MRQLSFMMQMISTLRLVEDGMSTGLTNTRTDRGFSDLYYMFARKQCILCSALPHKCCLHYCVLHRFEIFSAPGIIAHDMISGLLPIHSHFSPQSLERQNNRRRVEISSSVLLQT